MKIVARSVSEGIFRPSLTLAAYLATQDRPDLRQRGNFPSLVDASGYNPIPDGLSTLKLSSGQTEPACDLEIRAFWEDCDNLYGFETALKNRFEAENSS